jgi:LPS-assembly protein
MRRKSVLSHPQPLFSTFPANAVVSVRPAWRLAVLPAMLAALYWPLLAHAQVQSVAIAGKPKTDDKSATTFIQAEQISGRPDRFVNFDEKVEVVKGNTTIIANHATYRNLEDEVDARGDVRVIRNGDCYNGDSMKMRLDTNAGSVLNPTYKLLRNNGQGGGDRIDFQDEERSTIFHGTYSTCEGLNPDWYLKTDTLNLDTGLDTGIAGTSMVYFKRVPILAVPSFMAMSFPLSDARHSGVLPPSLGSSSNGGMEVGLPYYFNIAPNRDLTVFPKYIQKRGLQVGLDGRYLGVGYAGETNFEFLPSDKQTGTNRYALSSIHTQTLMPKLTMAWNINYASDDEYPADFAANISKTAVRVLPRDLTFMYAETFWNVNLLTSKYQVLQELAAPITPPYDRLPQLTLHGGQFDVQGFDWAVDTIFTSFGHPTMVQGERLVLNPQVSLPFIQPGFFVIPKLSLHAASYSLSNPGPGLGDHFQIAVPTVSVDSGLIFERQANWFGSLMTQTLEPRLFYVNTPYRDQSLFPNFDSGTADFNFAQMFTENRFTGQDRIGDANQITTALVSRFIEIDGEERFKMAIGQRLYFNQQKVTLGAGESQSRSDLLLSAGGKFSKTLSADINLQISQTDQESVRSNFGVRWNPGPKKVINAEYRFQRDKVTPDNQVKQIDVSMQWPVADRWYMVGRSNFSLQTNKLIEGLAGFEYKQDCWSFRVLAQRFVTATSTSTTGISIQLELNGLAKLGSNTMDALRKGISGYQPIN